MRTQWLVVSLVLVCVVVKAQNIDITVEGGTREDVRATARLRRAALDEEIASARFPDAAKYPILEHLPQVDEARADAIVAGLRRSLSPGELKFAEYILKHRKYPSISANGDFEIGEVGEIVRNESYYTLSLD